MKKILLFCCLSTTVLFAQTSGKITYHITTKFDLPQIEGLDSAMMAQIPRENNENKVLLFGDNKSLYQAVPVEPVATDLAENKPNIVIKMGEDKDVVFSDYVKKVKIEQRDFMSRLFLIETPFDQPKWKMTGKQKTILNYVCQEIQLIDSTQNITCWFAPQLAQPIGPGPFVGFPGAILGVDMDNGKRVVIATAIDLKPIEIKLLQEPKEGKKISSEKFQEMVEQKQKEMQEQYGDDGGAVIRVIKN